MCYDTSCSLVYLFKNKSSHFEDRTQLVLFLRLSTGTLLAVLYFGSSLSFTLSWNPFTITSEFVFGNNSDFPIKTPCPQAYLSPASFLGKGSPALELEDTQYHCVLISFILVYLHLTFIAQNISTVYLNQIMAWNQFSTFSVLKNLGRSCLQLVNVSGEGSKRLDTLDYALTFFLLQ